MAISARRWGRAAVAALVTVAIALTSSCGKPKTGDEYLREATAHRAAGDLPAALVDVKNALQQDPKNIAARVLLGQLYLELPDAMSAEAALLRARQEGAPQATVSKPLAEAQLVLGKLEAVLTETDVHDGMSPQLKASLLAARGQALLALGRIEEAHRILQAGLAEDPHSVDALAAMVRDALAAHDLPAAQERLAQAKREDPGNLVLLSLEGTVTFAAGDYLGSEQAFQRIYDAAKWNLSARLGIARAQIAEDKLTEADANLAVVLKAAPGDPNVNYLAAVLTYRKQDYVKAQSYAQHTLNGAKDFAPALLLVGASSLALKQYEQANLYLGQYVYLVPQNVLARKLLAAVQVQLGHADAAVKTLSPVVAQRSDDAQLLGLIGVASAQTGDLAAADRYLRLALAQHPDNAGLRAQLGMTQVALGNTEAGIAELERANQEDPGALRPEIVLFVTHLRRNELDKGLDVAKRVQKNHPVNAAGFDLAGLVYFAKGDNAAARTALLKARRLRSGDALALRLLASMALREGNLDGARGYFRELLDADPKNAPAYVGLAELDVHSGRMDEAEATLRAAVRDNPDEAQPRQLLGRVLLIKGQNEEAQAAVDPALLQSPQDPGLLEIAGRAQLGLKNASAATGYFKVLVGVRPEASVAHRYLAQALAASGNVDLGAAEARKALDLDAKDIVAKVLLAQILLKKRNYGDAQALSDELAAAYPEDPGIAELQGEVELAQDRAQDAVTAFQRGLAHSDTSVLRSRLATAQVRSGHPEEAEKTLLPWIASHPEDPAARLALGDVYMAENRLDEAASEYGAIAARYRNSAIAENNLAWVLSLKGQPTEALAHARQAASLAPNAPEVLDTLGVLLVKNERAIEAVETLRKATALAPANPDIQFHLAQALARAGGEESARAVLRTLLTTNDRSFGARDQAQKLLQDLGE